MAPIMNISPEAAKALEMMPIKPRRQDWDPDADEEETKSIEFQYGRNSKDKVYYFASIFSGKGGLSEAVPHARNTLSYHWSKLALASKFQ